jgi:DNA-binding GntR family transcriptional regulator
MRDSLISFLRGGNNGWQLMTGTAAQQTQASKAKTFPKSQLKALASSHDTSRGEFVYQALLDAIRQGRLRQGDRVREDKISESLNVSRTPVREALHKMQVRGLLTLSGGRGLVVATLSRQQMIELYTIRELLEGGAARFAAQYASSHEIDALNQLLRAFAEAGGNFAKGERLNKQFHQTICSAARNNYLSSALDDIRDLLALLQTGRLPDRCALSLAEHTNIVRAIEERAPEKAELAARQHVREACQAQLRLLTHSEAAAE